MRSAKFHFFNKLKNDDGDAGIVLFFHKMLIYEWGE